MNLWEQNVRKVEPYIPGEQPKNKNVIKLNTNENPFPPSPRVEKLIKEFESDKLRLYPDTDSTVLVDALAERYGVNTNQIFVGVGSDDVLAMAFLTFFNSDKPVIFPDITYSFYDVWCDVYRIPYQTKPLKDDFTIDVNDYICENGGIVIPNPNAPTGVLESVEMFEEILKANPQSIVIVDEAYIDFGGKSCLELIEKYDNLLVVQTFSKSRSMAGARIGFAFGNEKLIKFMNDVKFSINSYTMNWVTQLTGAESVKDEEYFRKTTKEIIAVREYSKERLASLGFTFTDSMSNFIFASHKTVDAKIIFEKLKERNIFVRYWNKPRISNYLRITVGTREQMDAMFACLEEILA
ncbi:MAG: histidinol-phosphate transaminase [Oscillospiraceae bacterium]|nr:histidinol-phosphate transaminase [Oscillospiraceae bacterium]